MSYRPARPPANPTGFGPSASKDLRFQERLIAAKWRAQFAASALSYRSLLKAPTDVDAGAQPAAVSGGTGTTRFDPLYGESIDPDVGGSWRQAQGSGDLDAGAVEAYAPAVAIPARVNLTPTEDDLKRHGFERDVTMVADVPAAVLDDAGVAAKPGDVADVGGLRYVVTGVNVLRSRWLNTFTPLFVAVGCRAKRQGS